MNTRLKTIVLFVIVVGLFMILRTHPVRSLWPPTLSSPVPIATTSYACNEKKTITVSFYENTPADAPAPGRPPTPTGSAKIQLSDGRTLALAQTVSADGARYANKDESFLFWGKGNGAFVLENEQEENYIGCVVVRPDSGGLSEVYQSGTEGFSIRYPEGYTVDASYLYQGLSSKQSIGGVKFTVSPALAKGTNLSVDSYISIEQLPQIDRCSTDLFLESHGAKQKVIAEGDVTYSVASSTGAGAGNRYEETVYVMSDMRTCRAVRYFIHYGVIENYPKGVAQEFDKQRVLNQFDAIRRTLVTNM